MPGRGLKPGSLTAFTKGGTHAPTKMHELDDNRSSGIYEAHRPSEDTRGQKDMRIRRKKGFTARQIFFNSVLSHSNRNSRQLSAKHANITAVNVNQIPKNGLASGNIFQCSSTVKVQGKQSRLPQDRASAGIWWRDRMRYLKK